MLIYFDNEFNSNKAIFDNHDKMSIQLSYFVSFQNYTIYFAQTMKKTKIIKRLILTDPLK